MKYLNLSGRFILGSALTALVITLLSLYLVGEKFQEGLFWTFFKPVDIFIYNFIPIFLMVVFLAFIFGSLQVSILVNSIFWMLLSYINVLKIQYRQEFLFASDIKLVREALLMAKKYSLKLDPKLVVIFVVFGLAVFAWSLLFSRGRIPMNLEVRCLGSLISLFIFIYLASNFMMDPVRFQDLGVNSGLNTWQGLNNYASKGFAYPLVYSFKDSRGYIYDDYNEKEALETDKAYQDADIPAGQKVNFMCIMLESYKDFYKFQNPRMVFRENPYAYWYQLKNESISGNLYVDTFGGGTLVTEKMFWSGYKHSPNYTTDRKTHVSYFKDQGYRAEAFHPSDGLFNNRKNLYPKVGFDNFFYEQNYFSKAVREGILPDCEFFPELMRIFKDRASQDQPYFSWSITYQGHGPYPTEPLEPGQEIVTKQDGYDENQYWAFNHYLRGVKDTTENLKYLVDNLRDQEPTILILFGDHCPSMGDQAIGMSMMGIPCDLSSLEGSVNTYETPYMVWANPAAKELFAGKNLVGQGPNLDANLLMDYVFKTLGWRGDKYTAFSQDYMDRQSVMKDNFFFENGQWTLKLSDQGEKIRKNVLNYEYYLSRQKRNK